MTKKHWITRTEANKLYKLSSAKLRLLSEKGLIKTKLGKGIGRGRKPFLFNRAECQIYQNLTLKDIKLVVDDTLFPVDDLISAASGKASKGFEEVINWIANVAEPPHSNVNHPQHYNEGSIEVIDAIDDWNLDFSAGNIVKYIVRAAHKGNQKEDLEKALWYIQRMLNKLQ